MVPIIGLLRATHNLYLKLLGFVTWAPPLVARYLVGMTFAPSGWGKIHHLSGVTEFFDSLHIPHPYFNAVLASYSELIFGTLLLLDLFTRYACIPLIIIFIVAIKTNYLNDPEWVKRYSVENLLEYWQIFLMLFLMVYGAGLVSLDQLVKWRWGTPKKVGSSAAGSAATSKPAKA